MSKIFREPRSLSFLLAFVGVLVGLFVLNIRRGYAEVPASSLVGTYVRPAVPFVHTGDLPTRIMLGSDSTVQFFGGAGDRIFSGRWRWMKEEGILRVDNAMWDWRIRSRNTLFGPRLCMRIRMEPVLVDRPEHDEEIDLVKEDPH